MLKKIISLRVLEAAIAPFAAFCALSAPARGAADAKPPQAFLRVNGLYLLYTAPVVPYVGKSGALMVGLEGFGRALFAKGPAGDALAKLYGGDYGRVAVDAAARAETLTLGDHTVAFTADSATARMNGASVRLETPARWDAAAGQMVVPTAALARCLGLASAWDPARRVLSLTGPDVLTSRDQDDYMAGHYDERDDHASLVPWRATSHEAGAPAGVRYPFGNAGLPRTPWLLYEAKNVSGASAVGEELNVLVLYRDGGKSANLDGLGPGAFSGTSPTVPPGGVRRLPLALSADPNGDTAALCVISYPTVLSQKVSALLAESPTASAASPAGPGFIDPSVTGKERAAVAKAMSGLGPDDRQNVIVLEPDGTFYANRPQLRNLFSLPHPVKGNLYEDRTGRKFVALGPQPKPTADFTENAITSAGPNVARPNVANPAQPYAGSGPYIRYYTTPPAGDSAQGFAYESTSVYLPGVTSSALNVCENPADSATAQVYMGGWGAGANPEALDVGFQHEGGSSKYASAGWNDDWVAYFALSVGNVKKLGNPTIVGIGDAVRFASNQTATLKFYVSGAAANAQLNFVWGGNSYDFSTHHSVGNQPYTLAVPVANSGWTAQGAGMILKSMTSIAQQYVRGTTEDDFQDGSFVRGVVWSNSMFSRTGPNDPNFNPQPAATYTSGNVQLYPATGNIDTATSYTSSVFGTTITACTPAQNPNNSWDRTDNINVP